MVELLEFRHHMRWLVLCTDNLSGDVKAWGVDFRDRQRGFSVVGRRNKLSADPGDSGARIVTLNNCRLCKQCVKTPTPPERLYGEGVKGARLECQHWAARNTVCVRNSDI